MAKKIVNPAADFSSETHTEFMRSIGEIIARCADLSEQRQKDIKAAKAAAPAPTARSELKPKVHIPIVEEPLLTEQEELDAGAIGFMARAMVMATMPHKKTDALIFERTNGHFTLYMMGLPKFGLPYGTIPRLIIIWMTTEAKRTENRKIFLGESQNAFLRSLNLIPSGGHWGTVTRLKEQMRRLLTCSITCVYDDGKRFSLQDAKPVQKVDLWWDPVGPEDVAEWQSSITLSEDFFNEVVSRPVPISLVTLASLQGSSMALDLYCWLTYRNFYSKRPSHIPWDALQAQFGAGYPTTSRGKRNFKINFIRELKKVSAVYPEALKLRMEEDYLVFIPGKPDVPPKSSRKR